MLSSLFNVFYVVFLANVLSDCAHTGCGWLLLKCSAIGKGFNGVETNIETTFIYNLSLSNYERTIYERIF